MATTAGPPILIGAENNFVENVTMPAPFHAPPFCTTEKIFVGELKALFSNTVETFAGDSVMFWTSKYPVQASLTLPFRRSSLASCICTAMTQVIEKKL